MAIMLDQIKDTANASSAGADVDWQAANLYGGTDLTYPSILILGD